MKIIILSAGQGRRLLPLTADVPKCALPVAGKSVLRWQLEDIGRCDQVEEVVVATGFAADKVEAIVGEFHAHRPRVRSLYNPFFASSDNLATCWVVRHEMQQPFVLINGDTLFDCRVLQRLLTAPEEAPITLTVDRKPAYDDDDMKVILENGRLRRVGKKLDRATVNGESIGMTRFSRRGADLFRAELERAMRFREGQGLWYLSAIDSIARKHPVGACLIDGLGWCEIDTADDLDNAGRLLVNGFAGATQPFPPLEETKESF